MSKLIQLQADRAAKVTAQKAIIDARNAENRDFTEDESAKFNTLGDEIRAFDAKIATEKEVEAAQARAAAIDGVQVPGGNAANTPEKKTAQRYNIGKAIREAASGKLTGLEKEMHDEQVSRNASSNLERSGNLQVPAFAMRADGLTASQDGGDYGAQLVQDGAPMVQDTLYPKTVLEQMGATYLRGLSGGSIPLPRSGQYGYQWLAEDGTVSTQKQIISGPRLEAKRAAVQVPIYNRLIAQSSVDVMAMIQRNIITGKNVAVDRVAINGDGILEPEGILNNSDVLTAASTTATAPVWADIVELQTLIDEAESMGINMGYIMNPALAGVLKTVAKDAGSGRFLMEGALLDGYRALTSSLVPKLAGNSTLILGNWSDVYVGEWGTGLDLSVDGSSAAASAQAAHIVTVNAHVGVAIANPKAFAVNKFLTA